ncbi:MATE family efflux transporter [Pragia fontium]|uniref:Multidrug-efflux transporter n=2 Tax=Pragia fontium TaxID=82985 RepID=A0AAJ4WB50_9GAMM|nr:MATE family efflux transporter [Pragia fontium]AKJ42274.1 multidrug transporter [Pragia fontium]SFC95135.1 multidrug resistance protein, MATE family [Pragia fontium DSM 5563 = ATCC 49100]SUB82548.1 Multidrug-efflux transporter [Pragia fontium]VEJ55447.1 Multidrug-efflux transporter [Pragia fontium]GKX61657.1 multidrug resistance protein MdtK [Pragia fontium]
MQKYISEARSLLALAIPVIAAQFSQTAMGVVDTIMAGDVSATDMAAVAVGTSIWLPAILFGQGLLMALTPVVAQLNGAGRRNKIAHQVTQSIWLALFISLLVMVVLYNSHYIIEHMQNIDQKLAEITIGYLRAIMWGAPAYLLFQVYRSQCDGLSKTKPSMVIGFVALLVNIPVNYVMIHGKLGFPALGGVGCGVATATVYWVMFVCIKFYVRSAGSQKDILAHSKFEMPYWPTLKRLFNLGLPVALALFFEVTLFAVVALLVSPLGVVSVAGHQIALNFSSLVFVIPLALGVATSIRIGFKLGQKKVDDAKIASYTSLILGLSMASMTALFTVVFRHQIALLYNDTPEVVVMASHLMLLAAIYQCSDSIQVIGSGVLRGYKDTRSIFFITFTSYWIIGLPVGYILGLTDLIVPAMGPAGFWTGFIIGLTISAIMMTWRMRWLQKQPVEVILSRVQH